MANSGVEDEAEVPCGVDELSPTSILSSFFSLSDAGVGFSSEKGAMEATGVG